MADIFDTAFQNLLIWEGGYGIAAHDDGGPTNLGIVQAEYDAYRKRKGELPQSVKYITKAEASELYRNEYWDATLCGQLNPGVANCVFDADVNSGDGKGVKWLQEAINQVVGKPYVMVDGKPGPATVTAANQCPPDKLIDAILNIRLAFMKVCRNAEGELLWPHFGRGWNDRIIGVRKQSHELSGVPVSAVPAAPLPQPPTSNPAPTPTMEPIMATATTAAPASSSSATAGVNVSTGTIMTSLAQTLLGFLVTTGGPILTLLQGTSTSHYLAAAVTGLVGLGSTVGSVWNLINANSAASSNTLNVITTLTTQAASVLPALQAATAPAHSTNPSPAAA